jgi:eukaryotic-like serine/threonine-protein kinase
VKRVIGITFAIIGLLTFTELLALPHRAQEQNQPAGKLIWKFEVGYRAYLAAANGVIYATSPTGCSDYVPCGPPARLFALDGRTGTQKWVIENIGDDSAPVIADGLVYQAGGSLHVINAHTGLVEWKLKPSTTGTVMHSPVISEGTIFFWEVNALIPAGFFGGTLYAVDLQTRRQKWKFSVGRGIVSGRPVAGDGRIYIANTGELSMGSLYAIDARTGKVKWQFGVAGSYPAISRGVVYYAGADDVVYALEAGSGKKLWQVQFKGGLSSPIVADRTVYVTVCLQKLQVMDSKTGQQKWDFKTDRGMYSTPVIASGVVYVGSFDGHLYAIDAKTGRDIWKFKMGAALVSPPAVFNDTVYAASHDGYIYAIQ